MLKKILTLSGLCLTGLLLTACNDEIPSTAQIELRVPESILNCKHAPRSPGRNANERDRARYILALYDAWEDCHGNLNAIRPLYKKYRKRLEEVASGNVKRNFNK